MTKLGRPQIALVLSLAAVAAAGCGSSSKSKTTAAPTPATPSTGTTASTPAPTSGFAAQVNTLCKRGNAQGTGSTNLQQLASIAESYVPKFEALTPPAAQKATYDKYVANLKAEIAAAKKNDITALKKLVAESHLLGHQLGAPAC